MGMNPRSGRLRVVADIPGARGYVGNRLSQQGHLKVTTDPSKALQIQFNPSRTPHQIKLVVGKSYLQSEPRLILASESFEELQLARCAVEYGRRLEARPRSVAVSPNQITPEFHGLKSPEQIRATRRDKRS